MKERTPPYYLYRLSMDRTLRTTNHRMMKYRMSPCDNNYTPFSSPIGDSHMVSRCGFIWSPLGGETSGFKIAVVGIPSTALCRRLKIASADCKVLSTADGYQVLWITMPAMCFMVSPKGKAVPSLRPGSESYLEAEGLCVIVDALGFSPSFFWPINKNTKTLDYQNDQGSKCYDVAEVKTKKGFEIKSVW